MKIKFIFGLAVAGLFVGSCQSSSYKVEGYAHDFAEGDTICMRKISATDSQVRYTTVAGGKFYFAGEADSVTLYEIYANGTPEVYVTFFNVAATTTVELNRKPQLSRVSGTTVNNRWQQLGDSINYYAAEMKRLLQMTANDTLSIKQRALATDSLHRQISELILRTAVRNKDNPLGQYIQTNYKAPEFK